MNETLTGENDFLIKLTKIVLANLENRNFGVKELESASGIGRATLNHRLNAHAQKTINQFIREVRLQQAREILISESVTASEVAYRVGFGSPAYFSTCFRNYYGYPPGEVKKRNDKHFVQDNAVPSEIMVEKLSPAIDENLKKTNKERNRWIFIFIISVFLVLIIVSNYLFINRSVILSPGRKLQAGVNEKSIAVLPFINITDNSENQYFTDGIMEEIHSHLCQISNLKVVSRTSVEQFRNTIKSVSEIAQMLGVNFILEGSVQKYMNKVRINVRLIDARHDQEILSESFDRKLADIFKMQSSIARHVAQKLQTVLSEKEIQQIEKVPTKKTEAYNCYLKGRFFMNRDNVEGINKSFEYFERAIASDAGFAPAYSGMAESYFIKTWWGNIKRSEGYEKAKSLSFQALKLDANLAEAHAILGRIYCYNEWNWEEAEKELVLAINLNPNYATAYYYYSEFLDITGQQNKAVEMINKAIDLDPLSVNHYSLASLFCYNKGNFEKSLEYCNKVIEIDPEYSIAYWRYFRIYYYQKRDSLAVKALQKIMSLDSNTIGYAAIISEIYNKSGMIGLLNWLINLNLDESRYVHRARFYAMLGDKSKSIEFLKKAMEEHIPNFCRIMSYYDFKDLHSEPGYIELIKKVGLTSYFNNRANDNDPVR